MTVNHNSHKQVGLNLLKINYPKLILIILPIIIIIMPIIREKEVRVMTNNCVIVSFSE